MPLLQKSLCSALTDDNCVKLKAKNLLEPLTFLKENPESIAALSGVSFQDILSIRNALLAQNSAFPVSGTDLHDELSFCSAIFPTGIKELDSILSGGLYCTEITELCGPSNSGKTEVCLRAAFSVSAETSHKVVYLDCGGSVDEGRLRSLAQSSSHDDDTLERALERVQCMRVLTVWELVSVLEHMKEQINKHADSVLSTMKLLIVDCVTTVFLPILGGKSESQSLMMYTARLLKSLASELSIAVLVTNNTVVDHEGNVRPALGKSWASVPNTRIQLENGQLCRRASLVKSYKQGVKTVDLNLFMG